MNKIINHIELTQRYEPQRGDILTDEKGRYFLLCYVGAYVTINLQDGHWYSNLCANIKDAVKSLTFVKRDVTLTINES